MWCVRIVQQPDGTMKVMAVAQGDSLAFVNPTARRAMYQPNKHSPVTVNGEHSMLHCQFVPVLCSTAIDCNNNS